jgi:hypothetical protein
MLYPRGDVKKKEREALNALPTRRRIKEGAGGTTCYISEEA